MADAWIKGACHCGSVQFRVKLADGLGTARRCNCSFCRMRGAVVVSAPLEDIEILQGHSELSSYRFGTMIAQHYFCAICGIYTHHQRRSDPSQYGVNVACLAGVSPFDFAEVPVSNGVNHPADTPSGRSRIAGILRYTPDPG